MASSDGVTIAVHDLGGDGAPLLLCHATGLCGRAYEPLAAALTAKWHVFALDFRAHGDSTVPAAGRLEWAAMTDDFLAVVDALRTGATTVFGHSLGGAVAMLAEQRRPHTLRAAYLFEPIVLPPAFHIEGGPGALAMGARRRRRTFPSRAEAMARYASRPPLDTLRASALAAYVEHGFADVPDGSVELKCSPEHEAATFEAADKPTLETLAAVEAPVTVAVGTLENGWSPGSFGPAIAAALPQGRLEHHPHLGHFGPLENPLEIASAIVANLSPGL